MTRRHVPILLFLILVAAAIWWALGSQVAGRPAGEAEREPRDADAATLVGTGTVPRVRDDPAGPGEAGARDVEGSATPDASSRVDLARILSRFGGTVAGRAIRGVVIRGTEPVAEGTAYLFRADWEGGASPWDGVGSAKASVLISRRGTFGFDDLEDGTWYVGVQLEGLPLYVMGQRIRPGRPERPRLLYVLGTGSIHGRVLDEEGRPAVGVPVRVRSHEGLGCGMTRVLTDTGAGYRVDGLPPGRYGIEVRLEGEEGPDDAVRRRQVRLAQGQVVRVDVGREAGDPRLSGTVRTAWGDPLDGPGMLVLGSEEPDAEVIVPYDEAGRFAQRVPVGTYSVHVQFRAWAYRRARLVAHALDVREAEVRFEPRVAGATVSGIVTWSPRPPPRTVQFGWRGTDGEPPAPYLLGLDRYLLRVDRDGTWRIHGVPVGTYEITSEDWNLAWADGRPARFVVRAGDREVRVELAATPKDGR